MIHSVFLQFSEIEDFLRERCTTQLLIDINVEVLQSLIYVLLVMHKNFINSMSYILSIKLHDYSKKLKILLYV